MNCPKSTRVLELSFNDVFVYLCFLLARWPWHINITLYL